MPNLDKSYDGNDDTIERAGIHRYINDLLILNYMKF